MRNMIACFSLLFFFSCVERSPYGISDEDFIPEHKSCMAVLTDLPNDASSSDDKIIGSLVEPFAIKSGSSDYESQVRYTTSFTTSSSNTSDPQDISRSVLLEFRNINVRKEIGMEIDYSNNEKASEKIMKVFDGKEKIELSTSLEEKGIHLYISQSCSNKGYLVSTLYSSKETQELIIDEFTHSIRNDSITYFLKAHADDLELASRQFNDFDHPYTLDWRGDYNPVFDLRIDTFHAAFALPL